MRFRPLKQFNAILQQEYFEPTISWAFRVVLALNVPFIILSYTHGLSVEVTWTAFGAYLISLTDYRGLHYRKIMIQALETVLIVAAAFIGMNVAYSLVWSLISMFLVGMFAAFIRNWSDYGASIGVAFGFFFLFGLAYPVSLEQSIHNITYLLAGSAWAIVITVFSFPFRPSNPIKRSVARVWKANTEFLDMIVESQNDNGTVQQKDVTAKELAMRVALSHSLGLFDRQQKQNLKVHHYDALLDIRRTAGLFSATLSSIHEELETLKKYPFIKKYETVFYKTLSALAQASARIAIVSYTSRPEDLVVAKVRVSRCEIAIGLFKETVKEINSNGINNVVLNHFEDTLEKACEYLHLSIAQIEKKLNIKKPEYFESYKLTFNNFVAGVRSWIITDFLRNLMNVDSEQFKYALRVSLGLCIGVFIFKFFKIDHGYWIPLTMIIVIQPYYGATRKKSIERIVGTLAGIILGGLIMMLHLPHVAFTILLVLVSFFVAYFLRNNYKVGVFFVTIMMVILMQMSEQGTFQLMGWRIVSTLLGAGLAILAGYVFWPVWEKERFPSLMTKSLDSTRAYLERVIKYYNKELPENETWFKNRRLAEEANNNAFACVQRMFEEPENVQQKVDDSFALVGMNIRITREITSIALLAEEEKAHAALTELKNYVAKTDELFSALSESISFSETPRGIRAIVQEIKLILNSETFAKSEQLHFIKMELEKIVFELEAMHKMLPKVFQLK